MCDIGRRVYNRGMVAANDGNFSVKLNEEEILCTPTGVFQRLYDAGVYLQGKPERRGCWKPMEVSALLRRSACI